MSTNSPTSSADGVALREIVACKIAIADYGHGNTIPHHRVLADAAIAAVRAWDAEQAKVPAGGRDLAGDIGALRHYASSHHILALDHFIAAELTRLGWTCGVPGAGAGTLSADVGETIQIALPLLVRADDRTASMDRVAKAQMAVRAATIAAAAPVVVACGISEGARETIKDALIALSRDADDQMDCARENEDDEDEAEANGLHGRIMAARAELAALPVLVAGGKLP